MPYYKYEKFKKACGKAQGSVVPINMVLDNAATQFNLKTKKDLLDFIYNGGLENMEFVNTKEWDKNPDKANPVQVDAYKFTSIYKSGYIAFLYSEKTKKWIIKSFHLSDDRNRAMEIALRKSGLLLDYDLGEKNE